MERVAAAPVHGPSVRVLVGAAVVLERLSRMEQQICDTRDRDKCVDAAGALRKTGPLNVRARTTHQRVLGITKAEACARQSDLAEQGGKRDRHPHRLLTELGALHAQSSAYEGSRFRHPAGNQDEALRRDATVFTGPGGRLGHTVARPGYVVDQSIGADRVAVKELLVVEVFRYQGVGDAKHGSHVRTRAQKMPLSVQTRIEVGPYGPQTNEVDTAITTRLHHPWQFVPARAARTNLGVARGDTTKGDDQFAVFGNRGPRGDLGTKLPEVTDDMRRSDHRRGEAVVVDVAGVTADRVQKSVNLTLGVMEAPGARPAIGPAVDRLVAVIGANAVKV